MNNSMRRTRRDFIKVAAAVPAMALNSISFGMDNTHSNAIHSEKGGGSVQVTLLQDGLLRVRHVIGREVTRSLNEQVGLVTPGKPRPDGSIGPTLRTTGGKEFRWELLSPGGVSLAVFTLVPNPQGGFVLSGSSQSQDGWYGLGFQRKGIELHGLSMRWQRTFRHSEATVPFFFSTAGYGVFSNTTWPQTFDFTEANQWSIHADKGNCDVFLIYGPSPKQILDGYTNLCGRPEMPPRWALDPLYICRYYITQAEAEEIAATFRKKDIPFGMLGLEPGWEEVPYSMHWKWSGKRFESPRQMIERLHALGFYFELWESGVAPDTGYTDPAVRDAWFQKRVSQSLDLGVDFYKQDDPYPRSINSEELQAPALRKSTPANKVDAEAALIANSLYSETVIRQIEKRTGHRGIVIFNSYWASVGAHRWPTAWAADFEAGTGLINGSLSAHAMVSKDMDAATPAGIHFGYLTPFTIVDSWAYYKEPWLFPPHIENAHRFYAKFRGRLGPHLYTAAWESHKSGTPMMRPMLLEHPNDPEVRRNSLQYYLGDGLLVGQTSRVYLPAGCWVDYWTGRSEKSSGAWHECSWPEEVCGPLWVRDGSIIVTRPVTPHAFAENDSVFVAEVFPGERSHVTRLYEDDGISLDYRNGNYRITELACKTRVGSTEVTIHCVYNSLKREQNRRAYLLKVHTHFVPTRILWQQQALTEKDSYASLVNAPGQSGWCRDVQGPYVWIKVDPHWYFTSDHRGAGDPERDTPAWTGQPIDVNGQLRMFFGSEAMSAGRKPPGKFREADSIRIMLNPPERIALNDGSWLAKETTVYAWLEAGGQPVSTDGIEVFLEVLSKDGRLLRASSKRTTRGEVEFPKEAYIPGDTIFRVHTETLNSVEAIVRPAPHI